MAGFEKARQDLDAVGAKVVVASTDPLDKAKEVAAELSFPVAYGVTLMATMTWTLARSPAFAPMIPGAGATLIALILTIAAAAGATFGARVLSFVLAGPPIVEK